MPIDWKPLLEPDKTAVLVIECQEGIIGENAPLRALVEAVKTTGLLPRLAAFLACARQARVRVIHCTVGKRADGLGEPYNTPLTAGLRSRRNAMAPGSPEAAIVKDLTPDPSDIVMPRAAGMTAFAGCALDDFLRNTGVRTVIPTGVSINIAITGATIDAVNRGCKVVIASDCVTGVPPSYGQAVLDNTLRNLAWVTTAETIVSTWGLPWKAGR